MASDGGIHLGDRIEWPHDRIIRHLARRTRCTQYPTVRAAADLPKESVHLVSGRQGVQSTDGMSTLARRFGNLSAPSGLRRLDAEMKVPIAAHGRPASAPFSR